VDRRRLAAHFTFYTKSETALGSLVMTFIIVGSLSGCDSPPSSKPDTRPAARAVASIDPNRGALVLAAYTDDPDVGAVVRRLARDAGR
jgi:hypothetical protein